LPILLIEQLGRITMPDHNIAKQTYLLNPNHSPFQQFQHSQQCNNDLNPVAASG
jgi:hypothetical protein